MNSKLFTLLQSQSQDIVKIVPQLFFSNRESLTSYLTYLTRKHNLNDTLLCVVA